MPIEIKIRQIANGVLLHDGTYRNSILGEDRAVSERYFASFDEAGAALGDIVRELEEREKAEVARHESAVRGKMQAQRQYSERGPVMPELRQSNDDWGRERDAEMRGNEFVRQEPAMDTSAFNQKLPEEAAVQPSVESNTFNDDAAECEWRGDAKLHPAGTADAAGVPLADEDGIDCADRPC